MSNCVIQGISDGTHGTGDPSALQDTPELNSGVLRPMTRVMYHSRLRPTIPSRRHRRTPMMPARRIRRDTRFLEHTKPTPSVSSLWILGAP